MTTMKDKFEEFQASCGDAGDKMIGFAIFGTNLNILREPIAELDDNEILDALDELIDLIDTKAKKLANTVIE